MLMVSARVLHLQTLVDASIATDVAVAMADSLSAATEETDAKSKSGDKSGDADSTSDDEHPPSPLVANQASSDLPPRKKRSHTRASGRKSKRADPIDITRTSDTTATTNFALPLVDSGVAYLDAPVPPRPFRIYDQLDRRDFAEANRAKRIEYKMRVEEYQRSHPEWKPPKPSARGLGLTALSVKERSLIASDEPLLSTFLSAVRQVKRTHRTRPTTAQKEAHHDARVAEAESFLAQLYEATLTDREQVPLLEWSDGKTGHTRFVAGGARAKLSSSFREVFSNRTMVRLMLSPDSDVDGPPRSAEDLQNVDATVTYSSSSPLISQLIGWMSVETDGQTLPQLPIRLALLSAMEMMTETGELTRVILSKSSPG